MQQSCADNARPLGNAHFQHRIIFSSAAPFAVQSKLCYYTKMFNCSAVCAIGAEKILGNEIKQLGYALRGGAAGRVKFSVDAAEDVFRCNLCLRTADRVFIEAASYPANNFDSLFDGAYAARWQDIFKKNARIVVDKVRLSKSVLASERSVQTIIHKAIAQKLCDTWKLSSLPESGNTCAVRVYVERDAVELVVDSSGDALHKRGYRTRGLDAPLRETVAAAMLHLALWRRKMPLCDPFCGSGTIICEAVLYAHNAPPGFSRRFALEDLVCYDASQAQKIKTNEAAKIKTDCVVRIAGSDIDPKAVETARANAERACVTIGRALQIAGSDSKIPRPVFEQKSFDQTRAVSDESGVLLANPPYGERMGDREKSEELYGKMGVLFESFAGWKKGFITMHENFEHFIAHNASRKRTLKSGKLDTIFYLF
jgi:putative N6-adenine-specific DNA methylase